MAVGGPGLLHMRQPDLGTAMMLIFAGSKQRPEYVPWTEVAQIDFDGPANVYPITAGEEHPPDLNGE